MSMCPACRAVSSAMPINTRRNDTRFRTTRCRARQGRAPRSPDPTLPGLGRSTRRCRPSSRAGGRACLRPGRSRAVPSHVRTSDRTTGTRRRRGASQAQQVGPRRGHRPAEPLVVESLELPQHHIPVPVKADVEARLLTADQRDALGHVSTVAPAAACSPALTPWTGPPAVEPRSPRDRASGFVQLLPSWLLCRSCPS